MDKLYHQSNLTRAHLWPRRLGGVVVGGSSGMSPDKRASLALRRSRSRRGPRAKSPGAAPRRARRRLARADRPAPGASVASYFDRAPPCHRGRPSAGVLAAARRAVSASWTGHVMTPKARFQAGSWLQARHVRAFRAMCSGRKSRFVFSGFL